MNMKNGLRVFLSLLVVPLIAACASQEPVAPTQTQSYNPGERLRVNITFQSEKAREATRLGLYMISQNEGREKTLNIDDEEFFPKYFSIINTEVSDGMLYISNQEAYNFALLSYTKYQDDVTPEEYRDLRKRQILSDVILPQVQTEE